MTRTQALDNALKEMANYLISDSHDEHLEIQKQEIKEGKRKWKKI